MNFSTSFYKVGSIDTGRQLFISSLEPFLIKWSYFSRFLCQRKDTDCQTFLNNYDYAWCNDIGGQFQKAQYHQILWIQIHQVLTKRKRQSSRQFLVNQICHFSGIFELTNLRSFVKSDCSIGSFNLDAMLTKYSLYISAKVASSVIISSSMLKPIILSLLTLFEDAPNSLKIFHIDQGSSFPVSITWIVGTRQNRLTEAVLTCTHDLCCVQKKKEKYQFYSSENYHFQRVIFRAIKNHSILHGQVCVMPSEVMA